MVEVVVAERAGEFVARSGGGGVGAQTEQASGAHQLGGDRIGYGEAGGLDHRPVRPAIVTARVGEAGGGEEGRGEEAGGQAVAGVVVEVAEHEGQIDDGDRLERRDAKSVRISHEPGGPGIPVDGAGVETKDVRHGSDKGSLKPSP